MTNANKSPKIPNSAMVRNTCGKLIWNPYLGSEPQQKLIRSSDW